MSLDSIQKMVMSNMGVDADDAHDTLKAQQAAERSRRAAVEFEAVTISELLKPMFDTTDMSKNMFGGGQAEQQFRSLQITEMGKEIAHNGGIGLADTVYRKILEMQEKAGEG